MNPIEPGSKVIARAAGGESLSRRAMTGVQAGSAFEVVWVCKESEWEAAAREGREPEGMPWPADAVSLAREDMVA